MSTSAFISTSTNRHDGPCTTPSTNGQKAEVISVTTSPMPVGYHASSTSSRLTDPFSRCLCIGQACFVWRRDELLSRPLVDLVVDLVRDRSLSFVRSSECERAWSRKRGGRMGLSCHIAVVAVVVAALRRYLHSTLFDCCSCAVAPFVFCEHVLSLSPAP